MNARRPLNDGFQNGRGDPPGIFPEDFFRRAQAFPAAARFLAEIAGPGFFSVIFIKSGGRVFFAVERAAQTMGGHGEMRFEEQRFEFLMEKFHSAHRNGADRVAVIRIFKGEEFRPGFRLAGFLRMILERHFERHFNGC